MSEAPVLRVVRGDATPEEIAALVAVLGALGGAPDEATTPQHGGWSAPANRLRAPAYGRSPGGWRGSALPR
ncbi:MAG: acyl-CoA carboxylase subunit epsilon [Lapillicoccus sp.]